MQATRVPYQGADSKQKVLSSTVRYLRILESRLFMSLKSFYIFGFYCSKDRLGHLTRWRMKVQGMGKSWQKQNCI